MEHSGPLEPKSLIRGTAFSAHQFSRHLAPDLFDPILNVDLFRMSAPTFPPHPHAGFAAMTYILPESRGGFINRDSLGNELFLEPGSLHVSKASRGLVHEETPADPREPVEGLQIFLNLPARHHNDPPAAYHVSSGDVVSRKIGDACQSLIADGLALGAKPDALESPIRIIDIIVPTNGRTQLELPVQWGGLVVCIAGRGSVGPVPLVKRQASALANCEDQSDSCEVCAGPEPLRIVLIAGLRLRQPIYQQGPLILADPEMLDERMRAYHAGKFGEIHSRNAPCDPAMQVAKP